VDRVPGVGPIQIGQEVHGAEALEAGDRNRGSESLRRASRLRVQGVEEEGRGDVEDDAPAVHLGVGHPLPVGGPGRCLPPGRVGLPEDPERLPRGGIQGGHGAPASRHGEEAAGGVDGGGPEGPVGFGAEVVPPPDPGHLQRLEVVPVDLVQGRVAGGGGGAPPVPPLVGGLGELAGLHRCREGGQGQGQGRKEGPEDGTSEGGAWGRHGEQSGTVRRRRPRRPAPPGPSPPPPDAPGAPAPGSSPRRSCRCPRSPRGGRRTSRRR
jgi:hypothetical protein